MPSPKRWFPVSREINNDPEVWALTDRFGERALRVWLEILSVLDRDDNRFSASEQAVHILASRCRMHSGTVRKLIAYLLETGWIVAGKLDLSGSPLFFESPNYWKYRRRPEPSGSGKCAPPIRSDPNRSLKNKIRSGVSPVDNSEIQRATSRHDAEEIFARLGISPKSMEDV